MNYGIAFGIIIIGIPIAILVYKIIRRHKENVIINEKYKEIKQKKKDSE